MVASFQPWVQENTGDILSSSARIISNPQPLTITSNKYYTGTSITSDDLNQTTGNIPSEIIARVNEDIRLYFDQCMANTITGIDTTATTYYTTTTNYSSATDTCIIYPTNWDNNIASNVFPTQKETQRQAFIRRLKNQRTPAIINHRGYPARSKDSQRRFADAKPEELVALQLLRRMVSKDVFKKYLKHGFVTIQGPSGLVYQIRRGFNHIKVWKQGQLVCELCVQLRDRIPPTDEVIAKMVIAECDEIDIWRRANIYWMDAVSKFKRLTRKTIEERHLRLVA